MTLRTRRWMLSTLGAAPAAAALAACGAPNEATPKPVAAPIPLLHWFGYAPPHRFGLAQQAVLDDYTARNPGKISLEIGEAAANIGLAKIKTVVAAGTPPASWFGWQVEASDLHGLGALVDLNAQLKTNKDWAKLKADLIPTLVDGATWKGKLNLVPMISDPNVLGLNKKILAEANIPLPRNGYTWDEFVEIGRKVARPPDRVLFQFTYVWNTLQSWMFANGQTPLNADRTKVLYDTPQVLQTLEWLHEHVTRTELARNGAGDFDSGKTLTEVINPGTVTPPRYPNVDPGDGSGIFVQHYPLGPSNTKKEPITSGNVFGFMVFKGADPKVMDVAAEIAAWSVRPDVQIKVARASSNPPSSMTAAKDPALSGAFRDNIILKTLSEQARYNVPTPNFPSWNDAISVQTEALGRLAKGELRPKDALVEIQSRMQARIDEDLKRG
jgi:ABC-type glycerol-3-phosphate transport system substrate-binding protein